MRPPTARPSSRIFQPVISDVRSVHSSYSDLRPCSSRDRPVSVQSWETPWSSQASQSEVKASQTPYYSQFPTISKLESAYPPQRLPTTALSTHIERSSQEPQRVSSAYDEYGSRTRQLPPINIKPVLYTHNKPRVEESDRDQLQSQPALRTLEPSTARIGEAPDSFFYERQALITDQRDSKGTILGGQSQWRPATAPIGTDLNHQRTCDSSTETSGRYRPIAPAPTRMPDNVYIRDIPSRNNVPPELNATCVNQTHTVDRIIPHRSLPFPPSFAENHITSRPATSSADNSTTIRSRPLTRPYTCERTTMQQSLASGNSTKRKFSHREGAHEGEYSRIALDIHEDHDEASLQSQQTSVHHQDSHMQNATAGSSRVRERAVTMRPLQEGSINASNVLPPTRSDHDTSQLLRQEESARPHMLTDETLKGYNFRPVADRRAQLDQLMFSLIDDDDFLALCEDIEASAVAIGFGK